MIASVSYGIALALALRWLDDRVLSEDRVKLKKEKGVVKYQYFFVPSPARKSDKKDKQVHFKKPLKIKKND